MSLHEDLSRLLDGDLPEPEASALRARIARDPEVAAAWDALRHTVHDLATLEELPPPPALVDAVLAHGSTTPERTSLLPAVGWAVAAALAVALLMPASPPELVAGLGAHHVQGDARIHVGDLRIDVQGEADLIVEPTTEVARGEEQEVPMNRSATLGAVAGATLTLAVQQGVATVTGPAREPLTIEAGASRAIAVPGEAPRSADAPPPSAVPVAVPSPEAEVPEVEALRERVAELEQALAAAEVRGAVASGQLAAVQGDPVPWPDTLDPALEPEAFEARLTEAARELGLALHEVDCAEFPCVAVLTAEVPDGDLRALVDAFGERITPADAEDDVGLMLMVQQGDDGPAALGVAQVPAGEEPDPDVGHRTQFRAEQLLDAWQGEAPR